MAWDYAELSKAARACGGPEKLVEHIVSVSKRAGRIEMVPAIGGFFMAGIIVGGAVFKALNYFRTKKDATNAELEAAKAELVDGIKTYDSSHPEETHEEAYYIDTQEQTPEDIVDN